MTPQKIQGNLHLTRYRYFKIHCLTGFGMNKGNFSGGVDGFYRNEVEFLNRSNLESAATFDVYFTWRTPWNANLSVGTTNVLNSGAEDKSKTENGLDPFESIYGRIPYVRYQQDL